MTNEQREAINDSERHRDLLVKEAFRLSWNFPGDLGATLRASPENVVFESQLPYVDSRYYTPKGFNRVYRNEEGSERVIKLTDEIRSALLRLADLSV